MRLNIVLHEPEIPMNTGNIGRTCVATGSRLHLIEPLGFSVSEKAVRRAGLDYWKLLDVTVYSSFDDFLRKNPAVQRGADGRSATSLYMATTKSKKAYSQVRFEPGCYIMFGKESAGIPEEILLDYEETAIRIPMIGDIRSLNLSNSVAIIAYEALRQNNFEGMNQEGNLHRLHWRE